MPQAVDTFLKTILRSGLLDREQLQDALRGLPKDRRGRPEDLADHLIERGTLSRFQAQKLLQGASVGLRLGSYFIEAPIGRGGMGIVYLGRDVRDQQHVALKVLPPKKAREEERLLARFQREMDMSTRLSHPHIAQTYEVGCTNGVYYIVLEYIPGLSLHRLVQNEGPLSVERAARLFTEVASGLEYAHQEGLIHRDLKPSNIMVTPNDHAKVLDFGLALVEGEVSDDVEVIGGRGYLVGSFDYIAPEQTEDATKVDGRADIYSMGCSLFYALTGRPPFPDGDSKEKVRRHRHENPVPLTLIRPEIPDEFDQLVRKMMAKAPANRFASAAEVRTELRHWTNDGSSLPVESEGDGNFQDAVSRLQLVEATPEMVKGLTVIESVGVPQKEAPSRSPFNLGFDDPDNKLFYLWIALGFVGFWIVVLALLALVLLTR